MSLYFTLIVHHYGQKSGIKFCILKTHRVTSIWEIWYRFNITTKLGD